jgi:lipoprotein-anchoring transpeptidase ErfK/SrfK
MRAHAAAAAVGLGVALATAAPAHARVAGYAWELGSALEPAPAAYTRLSDERTRTTWTHVRAPSVVRAAPNSGARRVGRVRTRTFVGDPEVVVVLGRQGGWSRVRYPRLGKQVGWVPSRVLSPTTHVQRTRIVIDVRAERLRAYRDGRLALSVPVAVGAKASPTPTGRFYLRERVVPAAKGGPYGVLALGLSAFSRYRTDWVGGGQVAIHGTNEPQLIPGHVSNGCIRLHNADVRRLGRIVGVGTPISIR